MMEMQDDYGHAIFESIRITLVCGVTLQLKYGLLTLRSPVCNCARAQTIVLQPIIVHSRLKPTHKRTHTHTLP